MSTNHPVKTIFSAKSAFKPLSESRNDAPVSESVHGCDNSPLPPTKKLKTLSKYTVNLVQTFGNCNPKFHYSDVSNPKRVLTKPFEGLRNNGYDNIEGDYILRVGEPIISPEKEEYIIRELLGKGTFGQVAKCSKRGSSSELAVKIVKNEPNYTRQGILEIKILKELEKRPDTASENHIVTMIDHFMFRNHVCIVFEVLHWSLLDLLDTFKCKGLCLSMIQNIISQILLGISQLKALRIIHCDLKPENVLFKDLSCKDIKIIDLGSACFENNTMYTYIQSRYYRAPEVLLGMDYKCAIDIWSLGCIAVELYLGIPIFPGLNAYDQLRRIIEMVGMPDDEMIQEGKYSSKFFNSADGKWTFKTKDQFEKDNQTTLPSFKQYHTLTKIDELKYVWMNSELRKNRNEEKFRLDAFLHFIKGTLCLNPLKRYSVDQALAHPFVTGEPFSGTWTPPDHILESEIQETQGLSLTAIIAQHCKQFALMKAGEINGFRLNFEPESFDPSTEPAEMLTKKGADLIQTGQTPKFELDVKEESKLDSEKLEQIIDKCKPNDEDSQKPSKNNKEESKEIGAEQTSTVSKTKIF